MKIKYPILFMLLTLFIVSCGYDNFDEPQSQLSGKLSYNGKAMPWNGNSVTTSEAEIIQLYQDGYANRNGINVRVNNDGTYRALLFDGEYKMTMSKKSYPFVFDDWPVNSNGDLDTVKISVKGNTTHDIKVTPYYEIKNLQYKVEGANIVATFDLDQIIAGPTVKNVYVYTNVNMAVSKDAPMRHTLENPNIGQTIRVEMPISAYKASRGDRTYAFLRVAVELNGVSEYMWSEVSKLENIPFPKDVTGLYLKNAGPGFTRTADDTRPIVEDWSWVFYNPSDWIVNDAMKVYDGYGGLEYRWGRNRLGANMWDQSIINGKIYQATTMPAGKYEVYIDISETYLSYPNEAFLVVSKGNDFLNHAELGTKALAYIDWHGMEMTTAVIGFELAEQTDVSIGLLFYIDRSSRSGYTISRIGITSLSEGTN